MVLLQFDSFICTMTNQYDCIIVSKLVWKSCLWCTYRQWTSGRWVLHYTASFTARWYIVY